MFGGQGRIKFWLPHDTAQFFRLERFLSCPALSPLNTKFLKVPVTKNLLILPSLPELALQEASALLAASCVDDSKLDSQESRLFLLDAF